MIEGSVTGFPRFRPVGSWNFKPVIFTFLTRVMRRAKYFDCEQDELKSGGYPPHPPFFFFWLRLSLRLRLRPKLRLRLTLRLRFRFRLKLRLRLRLRVRL